MATMLRGHSPHHITNLPLPHKHQADARKQVAGPDKDGVVRVRPKYGGYARDILGSGSRYAAHHHHCQEFKMMIHYW